MPGIPIVAAAPLPTLRFGLQRLRVRRENDARLLGLRRGRQRQVIRAQHAIVLAGHAIAGLHDVTAAGQFGVVQLLESIEQRQRLVTLRGPRVHRRQQVDGGDETRVALDDFLQDGNGLLLAVHVPQRFGVLVAHVRVVGVAFVHRLKALQRLFHVADVLVVHPQTESRVQVLGVLGQDRLEALPGGVQILLGLALPHHVQLGQGEIELCGSPIRLAFTALANAAAASEY